MSSSPLRATPGDAFGTFRHAGLLLVFLLACTVAAFWRSYLTVLDELPDHFGWTLRRSCTCR